MSSQTTEARGLLERAEAATVGDVPERSRFWAFKRLLLRGLRVYTRGQADLDRAIMAAIKALTLGQEEAEATLQDEVKASEARSQGEISSVKDLLGQVLSRQKEQADRFEWLITWTESFRRELFYEVRFRLDERERKVRPEIRDPAAYAAKVAKFKDGLRVNLGAGSTERPDYLSVDRRDLDTVDIRADVRDLPFEEGQLAEIYLAHLIEHFPEAEMRTRILPYWLRLLRPGGKWVVTCPDAEAMMKGWAAGKFDYEALREVTFGTQEYVGNSHQNMFAPESLVSLLTSAGFSRAVCVARGRPNGLCLELEVEALK